jgi:hypothetical protein
MNSNNRIAATVYSLGTLFVSGICVQIPCIKEIMMIMMMMIIIIIIIIIIGATGTISKLFRKYMSSISGNHEVRELQKTAILGTGHIFRKLLT